MFYFVYVLRDGAYNAKRRKKEKERERVMLWFISVATIIHGNFLGFFIRFRFIKIQCGVYKSGNIFLAKVIAMQLARR